MIGFMRRKLLLPLAAVLCAAGLLSGCTDSLQGVVDYGSYSQRGQEEQSVSSAGKQEAAEDGGELRQLAREAESDVAKSGVYSSPEEVAAYLHLYERLPSNYITKRKAEDLGWDADLGNLWDVADGKSIGGDRFGNYEEQLPEESGRRYYECDVNYDGGFRDAQRLVYSNDGLIYYTEDHYETFTEIYP